MLKKLLMIIHSYPPASGSGMFRNFKFSRYLLDNGWLPCICTIRVKYSEKIDHKLQKEIPSKIKVFRSIKFDLVTFLSDGLKWIKKKFLPVFSSIKGKTFESQGRTNKYVSASRLSKAKKIANFVKYLPLQNSNFWTGRSLI